MRTVAMRRFSVCVVVLLAIAAHSLSTAEERFKPFKMKTLDGAERSFADVLGRATLVVFFFPTCKSCDATFPDMQKITMFTRIEDCRWSGSISFPMRTS